MRYYQVILGTWASPRACTNHFCARLNMTTRKYSKSIFLRVEPHLHEAVKLQAGRRGETISQVLEKLIEDWLAGVMPAPPWMRAAVEDLNQRVEVLEKPETGPRE